nr:MAG TPA: hypothetical protein [Microviridae sp.]
MLSQLCLYKVVPSRLVLLRIIIMLHRRLNKLLLLVWIVLTLIYIVNYGAKCF